MRETQTTPAWHLHEELQRRQAKNAAYSISAFARDLGVSQPYLSLILTGKRKLPLKRALEISATLGLSGTAAQAFLSSIIESERAPKQKAPSRNEEIVQLELDRFRAISQWYHVAILDLTTVKGFVADANLVAKRLGVSRAVVTEAVERLARLGLLELAPGTWKKTNLKLYVPARQSDSAVRAFHRQMIEKAKAELAKTSEKDFSRRQISGTTMAVNPKRIAEARKRVETFQKRLAAFLTEGDCTDLYQLNVQLFPLLEDEK